MAVTTSSSISTDQEKFLSSVLIARTMLKLVCAQMCDKVTQPQGSGTTAYFVRYKRMFVPMVALSETGTDPSSSSFTVDGLTVTLDQWGDILEVTDIAILATSHPLMKEVMELLSDNAQRVIDREIQIVWLAGTNVQYGDGSVTSRSTVTASMTLASSSVIHKARVTLEDAGAPPREGPDTNASNDAKQYGFIQSVRQGRHYIAIAGPQVCADVEAVGTSLGTWASTAMYGKPEALYVAEVGTWLGLRWVQSNFIPKFTLLGNKTAAVVSTNAFGTDTPVVTAVDGGGSLTSATTYYFKVTRKDKLRGFEENISIEHSMASAAAGNNESFTFNFSSLTAGYVYNLYFGSATGDANLKLHTANIEVGTTVTVTAVPSSTTTAPANIRAQNDASDPTTVHVVYVQGAGFCNWVTLQNLQFKVSVDQPIVGAVLQLKRQAGYKFMSKTMIRDNAKGMRLEVASNF